MADLVPTAAPIAVGDEGSIAGRTFRVLGRLQLDHGRGPWDEWYLGFDGPSSRPGSDAGSASWGWLARAQGRWYLTFAREAGRPPAWEALTPGMALTLDGTGSVRWVVSERGGSALLSAEGELPFAVERHASGRYADLEAEGGAFATLDFGDGSAPVQLFSGREVPAQDLTLKQTALGPRPSEKVEVERLTCPQCGAPITIFVPSQTERAGCQSCGALLDYGKGALHLLAQLEPPAITPLIPLGATGTLSSLPRTVTGFMQRSVTVDGDLYTFREYLLHSERGYSFLLEENHHWLHVSPVSSGDVQERGASATFQQQSYRAFSRNQPRVDFVIGEFYWKVARGDQSETIDYIAPPRLLSVERTESEVSWSEGEYLEPAELVRAFGLKQGLPRPVGVAAAQPNPHTGRGPSLVLALLAALWFLVAFSYELANREPVLVDATVALPARDALGLPTTPLLGNVTFSQPFTITNGPTTISVALDASIENGWVQVVSSLVPQVAGEPRELTLVAEHYRGSDGGEAWEEGDSAPDGYFSRVPDGIYTLRFVGTWQPNDNGWAAQTTAPATRIVVKQGDRSPACCCGALLLILLPWLASRGRRIAFEQRRRENGNL